MAGRSPLRFLAPIVLVAFGFALYTVVKDTREPAGRSTSDAPAQTSTPTKDGGSKQPSKSKRRTYTVKQGDTASAIAEKTGVSVETMEKLNEDFDAQTLAPGQRIRLRK